MARLPLAVILMLIWTGMNMAQSPCSEKKHCLSATNGCHSLGCCPDDYRRKPCPAIYPIGHCGGCNDYCRKAMPCIGDIARCGSCDDYCRKPLPTLLCPPCSPYLRCGPADTCCLPARK
jgi:hypothetical protein